MFRSRLISASILIPCVIITLFLLPLSAFKIIIALICILSAWEWGKLSRFSSNVQKIWILSIFILLSIISQISTYQLFFNLNNNRFIACITLIWWLVALLLILFYPHSATLLWNKYTTVWITSGTLIIIPFFWGMLILRYYTYNNDYYDGAWLLLYIMILVWGLDSSFYIIGHKFGCHQTTSQLSPNKTWEGYIGGTLIMIIIFLIFFKYIPISIKFSNLLFFLIITLSSILGDLTESMFKRQSGVKDSGQLIPGHGGILDTMDSLYSSISIFASFIILNNKLILVM